jgi:rRNA biogenesis protein RRP5
MILLGYVKSVHSLYILVNLPGRLVGRLPITSLSNSYSNLLQKIVDTEDLTLKAKTLSELFTPGQLLYVKVIDKCHGERQDILLSLLPQDINSEINGNMLDEGSVLLTAVQDVEDHGYILETGVKGIHGFLPKKNVKGTLSVGEFLFCSVQKATATALTFTAIKRNDGMKIETADVPNVKTLVPGSIVNFTVTRFLKNGVEGLLFDGSISAFANELYLPKNFSMSDDSNIGKDLRARIMYIVPLSNQIMVTLNLEDPKPDERFEFGKLIENAKVIRQTSSGILFKLEGNAKGFLPKKAIVKNLKNNFDIDSTMVKFSPNSIHAVRIMDFSYIEDMYLCTNDDKLLSEKVFSITDLTIGQQVVVKLTEKIDKAFKVKIGNVTGYLVGNLLHNQGKTLAVGDETKARVIELQIDSKNVQFTNLPGFLKESTSILSELAQLKEKKVFTGLVIKEHEKSFMILFFNHIKGIFRKSEKNLTDLTMIGGLKVGQVKNFEVESFKKDMLSLKVPQKVDGDNLGKIMEAKVTSVLSGGLQIFLNDLKIYGQLAISNLSAVPEISSALFTQLKEGDKFQVAGLLENQWSRKDLGYFANKPKLDFQEVVPGDILRCSVRKFENKFVELDCPLKNFNNPIKLSLSSFDNAEDKDFQIGEIVYVQVIAKNQGFKNSFYVTPSLHKVWNNDLEIAVEITSSYLEDVNFLLRKLKENGKPIGKVSLGQRVDGKIVNLLGNKLLIELDDGVFAQSVVENIRAFQAGKLIKNAVVVWIDGVNGIVHVTLNDKWCKEISRVQNPTKDLVCDKKQKATVVFSNEYISVCSLKHENEPLIFVPSKFHYNDYSPIVQRELGNASSKLIIKKLVGNYLIGVFVHDLKICQRIDKYKNKISDRIKRKADEKDGTDQKKQKTDGVNIDLDSDNEEEVDISQNTTSLSEEDKENSSQEEDNKVEESTKKAENAKKKLGKSVISHGQTTFTRKESLMKKTKKFGGTLKRSFKKNVKPSILPTKKSGKFVNKDSMVDKDLVNLVSYKNIQEDSSSKSPKKQKPLKKKSGLFLRKTIKKKRLQTS